jgi:hypothetical protein
MPREDYDYLQQHPLISIINVNWPTQIYACEFTLENRLADRVFVEPGEPPPWPWPEDIKFGPTSGAPPRPGDGCGEFMIIIDPDPHDDHPPAGYGNNYLVFWRRAIKFVGVQAYDPSKRDEGQNAWGPATVTRDDFTAGLSPDPDADPAEDPTARILTGTHKQQSTGDWEVFADTLPFPTGGELLGEYFHGFRFKEFSGSNYLYQGEKVTSPEGPRPWEAERVFKSGTSIGWEGKGLTYAENSPSCVYTVPGTHIPEATGFYAPLTIPTGESIQSYMDWGTILEEETAAFGSLRFEQDGTTWVPVAIDILSRNPELPSQSITNLYVLFVPENQV